MIQRLDECSECGRKCRTDQEIFNQTLLLANKFYEFLGYQSPQGFRFDESQHPTEQAMWNMACAAQEIITDVDVWGIEWESEDD
ncbi:conserved hypothetical protein [Moraxellaceae bacterium 17A]|nr:conserved hypothetical protein [Moraxellaceae bacterium 17A]